jgi:hypothetical protein
MTVLAKASNNLPDPILKYLEGNCSSLIEVLPCHFAGGSEEKLRKNYLYYLITCDMEWFDWHRVGSNVKIL